MIRTQIERCQLSGTPSLFLHIVGYSCITIAVLGLLYHLCCDCIRWGLRVPVIIVRAAFFISWPVNAMFWFVGGGITIARQTSMIYFDELDKLVKLLKARR